MSQNLTHIDQAGNARMVDVGQKPITARLAVARGEVRMAASTLALVRQGLAKKGDVLGVAQLAGIMAAKRTGELIPLCHPLGLDAVEVDLTLAENPPRVLIEANCRVQGRTGIEMEAMTAVSVAALTVYDMLKAVDRAMVISDIYLVKKEGGKSGSYHHAIG